MGNTGLSCQWARGTQMEDHSRQGGERQSKDYLVIVLHHHQCQFALFEIHFGNFRPGQRENIVKVQSAGKRHIKQQFPFYF